MRKTMIDELSAEEVQEERQHMEDVDGATVTVKKNDLNSYEQGLAKKHKTPFIVRTHEILIIE
jgi:hypothetical protein